LSLTHKPIKNRHYLTPQQLEYFKERLLILREEREKEIMVHTRRMRTDFLNEPDSNDQASIETERSLELQARDREQQLILKINEALTRIENGTYGYCEETGEPIGLSRLEAYPIATLSLGAQELSERLQKKRRV